VKVVARIVPHDTVTDDRVIDRVKQALKGFLAPLPPEAPFGASANGEIEETVQPGNAAAAATEAAVSAAAVAGSPSSGMRTTQASGRRGLVGRMGAPLASATGRVEFQPDSAQNAPWEGWPFGKPLYVAELYSLIQGVRGVRHVLDVKIFARDIELGTDLAGLEPQPVTGNLLTIAPGALICSMAHEIEVERL
ncbi:MAG: hypothetical protein ACRC1H_07105, partial [Caldilineaceae bacterium]